jgi:hypothetical protein
MLVSTFVPIDNTVSQAILEWELKQARRRRA